MKNRALFLMIATLAVASPAWAAPVFMLQFGSFETREEADQRLAALKTKHGGVLAPMTSGVREVQLPPDNLTVYRTQAGPVPSRAAAQSVCSQLASDGDECYVVETAIAPSFSPPTVQVAQAVPAAAPAIAPAAVPAPAAPAAVAPPAVAPAPAAAVKPLAAAPVPTPNPNLPPLPVAPQAPATKVAPVTAPVAAASATVAPLPSPPPVPAQAPAMALASAAPVAAPAPIPVPPPNGMTGRDPGNIASINRVMAPSGATMAPVKMPALSSAAPSALPPALAAPAPVVPPAPMMTPTQMAAASIPAPAPAPVVAAAPAPAMAASHSPAMQQALDKAAAEQVAREASAKSSPTPADAKPEGTFWSRVNPFGGSPTPAAAAPAAAPAPAPAPAMAAAPVPMPAPLPPVTPVAPAPVVAMAAAPAPLPSAAPLTATEPVATPAAAPLAPLVVPVPAAQLPPPPAPLMGHGAIAQANAMTPAPLEPAPVPALPPEPTGIIAAPLPAPGMANVNVGEAQRVPLTETAAAPPPPPPAPPVLIPGAPAVSLKPSATLGQKTLWANVGPFSDAQAALAYWDKYRDDHPDFPVVRVRVASQMQAVQRGYTQVILRVGPFARTGSINNLCATVDAQSESQDSSVRCAIVTDLGYAAQGGGKGYLSGSRYRR